MNKEVPFIYGFLEVSFMMFFNLGLGSKVILPKFSSKYCTFNRNIFLVFNR